MRITLAQAASQLGDLEANLARAGEIVRQAGRERSDLVVFPELFLTGYALGRVDEDVSLSADDPRLKELTAHAPRPTSSWASTRTASACTTTTRPPTTTRAASCTRTASSTSRRTTSSRSASILPRPVDARLRHAPRTHGDAHLQRRMAAAPRVSRDPGRRARAARADELLAEPLPRALRLETYWRDITVFYARMYQCYVVFVNRVGDEGEHLRFWAARTASTRGARSSARCPRTRRRS